MFFWDMMNNITDETVNNNDGQDNMGFPFMPPFPVSPLMMQMSLMPLVSISYLMEMLEKQKENHSVANLMNDEGVKKIIQDLVSIDATPEQLTKLQGTLDSMYSLYTKIGAKDKK